MRNAALATTEFDARNPRALAIDIEGIHDAVFDEATDGRAGAEDSAAAALSLASATALPTSEVADLIPDAADASADWMPVPAEDAAFATDELAVPMALPSCEARPGDELDVADGEVPGNVGKMVGAGRGSEEPDRRPADADGTLEDTGGAMLVDAADRLAAEVGAAVDDRGSAPDGAELPMTVEKPEGTMYYDVVFYISKDPFSSPPSKKATFNRYLLNISPKKLPP